MPCAITTEPRAGYGAGIHHARSGTLSVSDIDVGVLRELIKESVKHGKKK
jgi:hypothetical protein